MQMHLWFSISNIVCLKHHHVNYLMSMGDLLLTRFTQKEKQENQQEKENRLHDPVLSYNYDQTKLIIC